MMRAATTASAVGASSIAALCVRNLNWYRANWSAGSKKRKKQNQRLLAHCHYPAFFVLSLLSHPCKFNLPTCQPSLEVFGLDVALCLLSDGRLEGFEPSSLCLPQSALPLSYRLFVCFRRTRSSELTPRHTVFDPGYPVCMVTICSACFSSVSINQKCCQPRKLTTIYRIAIAAGHPTD